MRVERIESPDDPRVAAYRDLKDAAFGLRRALVVAEGRFVVRQLLAAPRYRVRSLLVTAAALQDLHDVLDDRTSVYVARDAVIERVVGFDFHRGCLALGERPAEPPLEVLLEGAAPRLLVILERMSNPDNLGGVFRNARAFGAGGVFLSPGCGDPLYRKAIRVSMGGAFHVPFTFVPDWPSALARLRRARVTIIALTARAGATDLAELGTMRAVPERVALLLGAEGEGLSHEARAAADVEVTIPMAPGVDSLNAATACGIALHWLSRMHVS